MINKKWTEKRITINLTIQESQILNEYTTRTGRPMTDIIRELIRNLAISPPKSV
jgi:predicted DNA-binding protein